MRRKPSSNNSGYNQHRNKQRYSQGGGSQGGHHQHNRPRRNYSAAREKYLAQARDALASGDRVMSEYYLQHADHCYRMMMEEGYNRPQPQQHQQNEPAQAAAAQEDFVAENTSQLPAFITAANYGEQGEQPRPAEPVAVQNWEERDA